MAIICLLPDDTYTSKRSELDDPHLTLGYFDIHVDNDQDEAIEVLRCLTLDLAEMVMRKREARVSGFGMFDLAADGYESYALVDLIDGYHVLDAKRMVEVILFTQYYAVRHYEDHTHGFQPHITQMILPYEDLPSCFSPRVETWEFKFDRIALWVGGLRWEHELV